MKHLTGSSAYRKSPAMGEKQNQTVWDYLGLSFVIESLHEKSFGNTGPVECTVGGEAHGTASQMG